LSLISGGEPWGKGRKWRTVKGKEEEKAYQSDVEEIQGKGVIEEVQQKMVRCFNHTFLLKKGDGGFRFILDGRALNQYLVLPHFKVEDIHCGRYDD
jgi:hypothetical protein